MSEVDHIEPRPGVRVPVAAMSFRFDTPGGPGGQHANRAATRVEITLNFDDLDEIDDTVVRRWRERLGEAVTVTAADSRSQFRNRAIALDRLKSTLSDALKVERVRRPTRPSAGSRRRRLDAKRRRSDVKRDRQRKDWD